MLNSSSRLKIRQNRTIHYFIEAADSIIRDEGINGVTIRKTAELAGYTSATLYNYFDDLSHLVFLAVITHLEEYNKKLIKCTSWCANSIERYLSITECFCHFAFTEPEIYELLFFKHSDEKLEKYTKQYYELFPERVVTDTSTALPKFFNINNIYTRSKIQLLDCVDDGFMLSEDIDDFNDMTLMLFKCLLEKVKLGELSKEEATIKMVRYYCELFYGFTRPEKTSDLVLSFIELRENCSPYLKEAFILTPPGKGVFRL